MPRAPRKCNNHDCVTRIPGHLRYCDEHRPQAWSVPARHNTRQGSTRASRQLREQVLSEQPYCYLRYDCCTHIATEVDHIRPKWLNGSDDRSNLAGACEACHKVKSQREARDARQAKIP